MKKGQYRGPLADDTRFNLPSSGPLGSVHWPDYL